MQCSARRVTQNRNVAVFLASLVLIYARTELRQLPLPNVIPGPRIWSPGTIVVCSIVLSYYQPRHLEAKV
jgi:hypothetical protein